MKGLSAPTTLIVDRTHMGRRASGLERITRDLFSEEALAPLNVVGADAGVSRGAIVVGQMLRNPARAITQPKTLWAFPGYPPAPLFSLALRERTVFYVHDLFLITRSADLNRAARLYMAPLFRLALRRLRYFLTNSQTTAAALRAHVRPEASIRTYRPRIANVFGLTPQQFTPNGHDRPLRLGAVGTLEPRKNFQAAAAIRTALAERLGRPVELHIIGRPGWGDDHAALAQEEGLHLHGFLADEAARAVIKSFDLYLCTSHDEGLGLPLLEVQYAGLPVIAPDQPVFWEVLDRSGLFIDPRDPPAAAAQIAALLERPDWRTSARQAALANTARWNEAADRDRSETIALLTALLGPARRA